MKTLSPQTRLLLDRARRVDGPMPRTREQIGRALAGAAATTTVTLGSAAAEASLSSAAASPSLFWLLPGGKLGAVLATSIGLASGTAIVAVTNHRAAVVVTPPVPASVSMVSHAKPLAVALPTPPSQTISSAAVVAPSMTTQLVPAVASSPPTKSSLADETRRLALVQRALRVGDGQQALMLLSLYRRDFGQGALVEEASAAEVFALCAVGDVEGAQRSAKRFLQRFSGSPLVPRVEASCGVRGGRLNPGQVDLSDGISPPSSPITEP
jgi:hypothetical protein